MSKFTIRVRNNLAIWLRQSRLPRIKFGAKGWSPFRRKEFEAETHDKNVFPAAEIMQEDIKKIIDKL